MIDRCISCGAEVPEGRFVCSMCERRRYPVYVGDGVQIDKVQMQHLDTICAEYCKYPDEYSSIYCDDTEEAEERLAIEKCENCPVAIMRLEGGLYDD